MQNAAYKVYQNSTNSVFKFLTRLIELKAIMIETA